MESWVKWQESGVGCPLAKLTGTPARDRDNIYIYIYIYIYIHTYTAAQKYGISKIFNVF